ncbi:MAG: hypothetical protein QM767_04230 [Anaeromyxobacter sp.]
MRPLPTALLALGLALPAAAGAATVPFIDLETGVALSGRNDVRIPGEGGTLVSLTDGDFSSAAAPYVRVRGGVQLGRHTLAAVWQPLRIEANGTPSQAIDFAGETFRAGAAVKARYRFDTYRLTYRYALVRSERVELALGATALLRDAEIALDQDGLRASKSNVGVVPLASFRFAWRFAGPVSLFADGDALAAPQGRAEDVAAGLAAQSGDFDLRLFYRVLEGGADNAEVYNFALIHQFGAGVQFRF